MKPSGRHIFASLKRAYAAQAQASRAVDKVSLVKQEPKVTRLPNGAVVASIENNSPISRVAITFNAGPRFESEEQLGITHCIRSSSNLSTERSTSFGITRNIQQIGGNIGCTSTREHLIYNLECMRSEVDGAVEFLGDMATGQTFSPWELSDNAGRMALELAFLDQNPQARLIEALHGAAFRSTVGHSLYMPEYKVGQFTTQQLLEYVGTHFTCGNMSVAGVGIEHEQLMAFASKLNRNTNAAPPVTEAKYHGGELRLACNTGSLAYAAIATEGAGLGNKDLLPVVVLQRVMGSGPSIKYSSNLTTSKVTKAAASATNSPFAASCFSTSYSDAGLFGFQIVAQAVDMGKVVETVFSSFRDAAKEGGISDQDVKRAKNQLQAVVCMEMEQGLNLLEDLATSSLLSGQVFTPAEWNAAIEKVTLADVQAVAKKLIKGKLSMAGVGNLSHTPYIDQLK